MTLLLHNFLWEMRDVSWLIVCLNIYCSEILHIFLLHCCHQLECNNKCCILLSNLATETNFTTCMMETMVLLHDDAIKWNHFPRYCSFVQGLHRSPVNSTHKGQWRGAFMFYLICAWINIWVNNRNAGDLRRHRAHNDVIAMILFIDGWPSARLQ